MARISMYMTNWCPYCQQAKALLRSLGVQWNEINIELEGLSRVDLANLTGGHSIPQIVINGKSLGGYSDLYALHQSGALRELLQLDSSASPEDEAPAHGLS